jgi:hypothetical protein
MKWFLYLLVILTPFAIKAQPQKGLQDAHRIYHCERYIVDQIARKQNGLMDTFARQVLAPGIKTIYIMKTDYIHDVPDTVNGYHLKLINVDSAGKFLYQELKSKSAVLLYLTDGINLYEQYTIWVMPVSIDKKGRKYTRKYELTPNAKVIFTYNTSTGLFSLTQIEYL